MKESYKFLFAAGGTGGHLYPAIAVAEEVKRMSPNSKILFVGTKKKLESRVVPELGFDFRTIWISGFSRKFKLENILFPIKLIVALFQSFMINVVYKPTVAIGAGAYVAGPIIWMSSLFRSKVVLMEQNSYPGITNRMLANKADSIHLSFVDSKKYFTDNEKLKLSGNPVRNSLELIDKQEAVEKLNLDSSKKILLVLGGSLGAKSINNAISKVLPNLVENNIQVLWQTGELYFDTYKKLETKNIKIMPFIADMKLVYSACDLVVARAGATTIAEVAYLGLPVVFVPSTNVAANHQYKNAKSIVDSDSGILIEDSKLSEKLCDTIINSINNNELLHKLRQNIKQFAKPNAARDIANDVLFLAKISGAK